MMDDLGGMHRMAARLRSRAERLRNEERREIVAIDLDDGAAMIEAAYREILRCGGKPVESTDAPMPVVDHGFFNVADSKV